MTIYSVIVTALASVDGGDGDPIYNSVGPPTQYMFKLLGQALTDESPNWALIIQLVLELVALFNGEHNG